MWLLQWCRKLHILSLSMPPSPSPSRPRCRLLSAENREDERRELLAYFDRYVSAWNPGFISADDIHRYQQQASNLSQLAKPTITTPQASRHPCQLRYGEHENSATDINQLITVANRHRNCSTTTCLKRKRGQLVCKAGFPEELRRAQFSSRKSARERTVCVRSQ